VAVERAPASRVAVPYPLQQLLDGHNVVRLEQEGGEQASPAGRTEIDRSSVDVCLHGTQNAELHRNALPGVARDD
jgi:hypothetical protein